MKVQDLLNLVKVRFSNITNRKQVSEETIVDFINEGLLELHSQFRVRVEQATILVPKHRNIFTISSNDKNVIMKTYDKLAQFEYGLDECKDIPKKEVVLQHFKEKNNLLGEFLVQFEKETTEDLLLQSSSKVLQILEVKDSLGSRYILNESNAFIINQSAVYLPNCVEGTEVYVFYKPQPIKIAIDAKDVFVDLPDTLNECLLAFISTRIINTIDGFTDKYQIALTTYTHEIKKALEQSVITPDGIEPTLHLNKGFF